MRIGPTSKPPVTDGMVRLYDAQNAKLNGSNYTIQNSVVGNTDTISFATSKYSSDYGGCFTFNGVDDRYSVNGIILNTVCIWMTFDQTDGIEYFIHGTSSLSSAAGIRYDPRAGATNKGFCIYNGGTYQGTPWTKQSGMKFLCINRRDDEKKIYDIYIDGQFIGTNSTTQVNDIEIIGIGSRIAAPTYPYQGTMSQIAFYNRELSPQQIKRNYDITKWRYEQSNPSAPSVVIGPSMPKQGLVCWIDTSQNVYNPLIYDIAAWADSQTGAVWDIDNSSIYNVGTTRSVGTDPWGQQSILWKVKQLEDNVTGGSIYVTPMLIDSSSTYRLSYWEKRVTNMDSTYLVHYFGANSFTGDKGVRRSDNNSLSTNFYFKNTAAIPSSTQLPQGEWRLWVGHIHPSNYSGGMLDDSGIYNVSGQKTSTINYDAIFTTQSIKARPRSLILYRSTNYFSAKDSQHHSYLPRMDLCDGTQPTIQQLIQTPCIDRIRDRSNNISPIITRNIIYNRDGYNSMVFNGVDTLLRLKVGSRLDANTFCIWFKTEYTEGIQTLGAGILSNKRIHLTPAGQVCVGNGGGSSIDGLNDGRWHFLCVIRDDNSYSFIIDEVDRSGGVVGTNIVSDNTYIGAYSTSDTTKFKGQIGVIHIYNRVLTTSKVSQLYNMYKKRYQ